MTSVTVTVGFRYPLSNPDSFPGTIAGLRIRAGDLVLTAPPEPPADADSVVYTAEGEEFDLPEYEFHGDWVGINVNQLQEAIVTFLEGSADRYHEYTAEISGETVAIVIVFSHLDGKRVRVAAKTRHDEDSDIVSTEAMLGRAVDPKAIARELIDCRRTMVAYAENAFEDSWRDFSDEIIEFRESQEEQIEELEALLER